MRPATVDLCYALHLPGDAGTGAAGDTQSAATSRETAPADRRRRRRRRREETRHRLIPCLSDGSVLSTRVWVFCGPQRVVITPLEKPESLEGVGAGVGVGVAEILSTPQPCLKVMATRCKTARCRSLRAR